jgi:hypothetical protein
MMAAGVRRRVTPEIAMLAACSAAALATVDVVYNRKGILSDVYLLDAVAEAGLIGAWTAASARGEIGGQGDWRVGSPAGVQHRA